ncbi:Vps54 domain-containing protein/DUF2450 domain-containing protein [Artemisia annua]|uniref:Vps54 domain-containing protein/DUF2450 domain-containing protein n=1 Tax=Artemisia annua TaxID=35608 RepID=A0A2U1Q2H5_ARTAN|nr:Vps54 domain-containing protein/DUF2450 domain-containing protein [Artemisia annua]
MTILVEGCSRFNELKEMIKVLDGDVMDSARQIHDLNVSRSDFAISSLGILSSL